MRCSKGKNFSILVKEILKTAENKFHFVFGRPVSNFACSFVGPSLESSARGRISHIFEFPPKASTGPGASGGPICKTRSLLCSRLYPIRDILATHPHRHPSCAR